MLTAKSFEINYKLMLLDFKINYHVVLKVAYDLFAWFDIPLPEFCQQHHCDGPLSSPFKCPYLWSSLYIKGIALRTC